MANYTIPTNPIYNATIRKLEDSDPASASTIFNPLIQQLIENTHAVKKSVDELKMFVLGAWCLWLGGGKQMTIQLDMTGLLALMSIPSAITGFCFWLLQKNITKRDADRNKQEEAQKKNELLLIRGVGAAITLGEATARAVQRIPDAHCNGDMHEALEYAQKVKHEQQDFLREQGIENLY